MGQLDVGSGKVLAGRYVLDRLLGRGGMGEVYLARQRLATGERPVALKVISVPVDPGGKLIKRFIREAETIAKLSHPNTVTILDFGQLEDGAAYFAMEYIEGETLSQRIKDTGGLSLSETASYLEQICDALFEVHRLGIVHRDLKPGNIMLAKGTTGTQVKVLDFGLAKDLNPGEDLTTVHSLLGTPPYMSPEQFTGDAVDSRSDIYALGTITYAMLMGETPFKCTNILHWGKAHLLEPPPTVRQLPSGDPMPPGVLAAIHRALSKTRDERQGDAQEFLREFVQGIKAGGVVAAPASTAQPSTAQPSTAQPSRPNQPEQQRPQHSPPAELQIDETALHAPTPRRAMPQRRIPTPRSRSVETSSSTTSNPFVSLLGSVLRIGLMVAIGLVAVSFFRDEPFEWATFIPGMTSDSDGAVGDARAALEREDYDAALRIAEDLQRDPNTTEAELRKVKAVVGLGVGSHLRRLDAAGKCALVFTLHRRLTEVDATDFVPGFSQSSKCYSR